MKFFNIQYRAVARKNKDWGNIHGWIPRLAIQGLYDDYVETKHCQDQTLNDWGKCLGLPHTGYGPAIRVDMYSEASHVAGCVMSYILLPRILLLWYYVLLHT